MSDKDKKEVNLIEELNERKSAVSKFFGEFKKFAVKGNVVDLAVGVIIGASFNNIVQSLVKDIILPPIGFITGKVDFSNLYFNLSDKTFSSIADAQAAGAPVIAYGAFLNTLLNFIIVAFVIFLLIRQINKIKAKEEEKPEKNERECPFCYTNISKKASKCPNCTSEVVPVKENKKTKK